MRSSIRLRLQIWYGFVLLAVVSAFAGILYFSVHRARMRDVDGALDAAAQYLDVNLRRFPPHELDATLPQPPERLAPEPPESPDDDRPDRRPPPRPGPPSRERLLRDLELLGPPGPPGPPRGDGPADRVYFGIWRADGSPLKVVGLPFGISDGVAAMPQGAPRQWRRRDGFRELTMRGPMRTSILVGKSMRREDDELRAFAWQLAAAAALVLAVGLAGGWWVSARILRPMALIAATASSISEANLSKRIDTDQVDRELQELAQVLNATFARLEAAFERQVRFTADASHELRTPLAVVRGQAELALSRPRGVEEYQSALESCLRAAVRMGSLVDGLLMLARADAGRLDVAHEPLDLQRLVEETIALLVPFAQTKQIRVESDLHSATVLGDASRLTQVATNLIDNAIQYNRPGGRVHVRLDAKDGRAELTVEDTGVGIPNEDCPHLFERFYRVDKARSRASGGQGLGLAICKGVVEAHGGTIGFTTEPGKGSTFWVRLPAESRDHGFI
jgi:two-component system, OmpR family, sensor kinase